MATTTLLDTVKAATSLETMGPVLGVAAAAFVALLVFQKLVEWHKTGTSFSILWLFNYPAGMLFPPDEAEVKGKTFLEVSDIGVSTAVTALTNTRPARLGP
jgi:hypothetical protein